MTTVPDTAQKVYVGIYPVTIHGLTISSSTYFMTGYLWLRWKGDIDPTKSLEFANSVMQWSVIQEKLSEEPEVQPDGSKLMIIRFEAQFYSPLSIDDFPLDRHNLTIRLEDSLNELGALVFIPDTEQIGMDQQVDIPGWDVKGMSYVQQVHEYGTNFGAQGAEKAGYSSLEFKIAIARPANFFALKIVMPLVIVLLSAFVGLLLPTSMMDTRTYMPVTALLTAIFLQQSYTNTLPQIGTLVLADKIYLLGYVLILITIVRMISVSLNLDTDNQDAVAAVTRVDKQLCIGLSAFFLAAMGAILMVQ